MVEENERLPRLEIPMSDAARKRIKARAKSTKHKSYAAYVRSLIAADIPDLKSEFDELAAWGGDRTKDKS